MPLWSPVCLTRCLPACQIWVISRHYGDDVHMSNLLERIAQGLQVSGSIDCEGLTDPCCVVASVRSQLSRSLAPSSTQHAPVTTNLLHCLPPALSPNYHTLQDRLDGALDISTLFHLPAAESLLLVRTCLAIARGWQAHYMAMREKIEASGHHARWEFSKILLFDKTNHIAEVAGGGGKARPLRGEEAAAAWDLQRGRL